MLVSPQIQLFFRVFDFLFPGAAASALGCKGKSQRSNAWRLHAAGSEEVATEFDDGFAL